MVTQNRHKISTHIKYCSTIQCVAFVATLRFALNMKSCNVCKLSTSANMNNNVLNSSYMFIRCLLLGIGISCCWPQGRADVVVTEVYELVEYYELVVRGSCRTGVRSNVLCDRYLLDS